MNDNRHTADSITDDALDALYAERDELRQRFHNQAHAATELIEQLGATEAELVAARSAIDRVRGLASRWVLLRSHGSAASELRAALDGPPQKPVTPPRHLAKGTNAEDCPACGTNPPYPFLCPGPATA